MAFKLFIDANVLLDFFLKRQNYEAAEHFFQKVVSNRVNAYISPSILHITAYWLTKAYGSAKTKKILLELLSVVTVIDAPHEIAVAALHSRMTDIEDALQYYTALHYNLDAFISQDKLLKQYSIASLPVYTLNKYLQSFQT